MIQLLLLILPVLLFIYKNKKNRPKTLYPPSPPGLPIIGNLHQWETSNSHLYLFKLAQKYGPLVLMKLGKVQVLIVSSAKTAKEVLKSHDLAFCSRPPLLGFQKLTYGGLDIAFSPYNDYWRELRKICVLHLFSNKQAQSFRPVREEEVFWMIKNITVAGSPGDDNHFVNLSATMLNLTSTLICRIAFGKRLGENESERRRFDELMIESQAMQGGFFVSDYLPLLGWVDRLSGMLSRLEKAFRDMDEFYQELIDEHLDPNYRDRIKNPNNILDLLIRLKEEKLCSIDFTWDHIKAVLFDIFVAGTDTSAAVTVWAMTALIKNPDAMKRLQKEIRETIGNKGCVNEHDVPKLPYLKAVIKETMRLYPPAPLLLPRETLEECTIHGYTIAPKTLVHINAWAIARDPECWENPNEFMPERFLDRSMDVIGQDFEVIPFGAGRRGCPGILIGLATVEMALANLVYSFDWGLPKGMSKEHIDMDVLPGITMHKKNPLCLSPTSYVCA